ncbi:hypothetical protein D3C80_2071260 [compost metagenome]
MKPCNKRSNHITQHLHTLRPIARPLSQFLGAPRRTAHGQQQLPQPVALNSLDAAVQQPHPSTEGAEQGGEIRLFTIDAGELQA